MRVLIFTFGTRGDVEPYTALAERLHCDGHEVVLSAPEAYRAEVEAAGVRFEASSTGLHELVRRGMATASGPRDALGMMRNMRRAQWASLQEQWNAAQRTEPTLIVAHPKALGGFHIAEHLGIPFVASLPLPFLTPTGDFPIPFLTGEHSPGFNRLSYQFNRSTGLAFGGMLNRFRKGVLGLRRASRWSDFLHRDGEPVPILYPFSPLVVPRPADYPASAHITGYWTRASAAPSEETAKRIERFLDGDGPIVSVGFGSMGFGTRAAERGRAVARALTAARVRAVVTAGWGALDVEESDDLLLVDDVPHDWLFPRMDAVVHHGGAGTTAAALRAGTPALVCPFLGDQPFWGGRVESLGVGPAPLPVKKLSAGDLADRLREMLADQDSRARARELARGLAAEDGTGEAVRILEGMA
ncbi:glycosyltransferase [Streptomyces sp. MS2A]|nr:glycosyltransferase [Streptomyces sp. MS2A]